MDEQQDQDAPPLAAAAAAAAAAALVLVMSGEMLLACLEGHTEDVIALLAQGESVNCRDEHGYTPLLVALYFGHFATSMALIERGADALLVNNNGLNALHAAAVGGNADCVNFVLDNIAIDINSIEEEGDTPLMAALQYVRSVISRLLVERGADLTMIGFNGWTSLHYATRGGDLDCLKLVRSNTEIDINATDEYGDTPLCVALRFGKFEAAIYLVNNGANLFAKDNDGVLAIDVPVQPKEDEPDIADEDQVFLGPQVLQHFNQLQWEAAKPILLLSKSFSSSTIVSPNPSISIPSSVISVLSNPDIIRFGLAPFFSMSGLILTDPKAEKQPDEVKRRVEAELASGGSSSKKARTEE
jgi:ankyrin repeat protein